MKSVSLAAVATLVLSCLTLTKTATASSVDFSNNGGTLTGSNAGLSLSGSTLVVVNGLNGGGKITGDLGSVTFTTAALISGTLSGGGTFAPGGTFTITGNGTNGIPNGVLFSGTFFQPVMWAPIPGTEQFVLIGSVNGTLNGVSNSGATVQLTVPVGPNGFTGSAPLGSGNTNVTPVTPAGVPEPSSLLLLATGAVGMWGMIGRKPLMH